MGFAVDNDLAKASGEEQPRMDPTFSPSTAVGLPWKEGSPPNEKLLTALLLPVGLPVGHGGVKSRDHCF